MRNIKGPGVSTRVDTPGPFIFRIIYNAAIVSPLPDRVSAVQECDATKATMFKNANKIVVL